MRAYVLRHPGLAGTRSLRIENVPEPMPERGQLRIRVSVCAVCRTDLHVVEGDLPERRTGITPGHQAVGVVDLVGDQVDSSLLGQRVGLAWLHGTCGACRFCDSDRENLCERAAFTGYTEPGGFAELVLARPDFVYLLPQSLSDARVAPLLCAGIIGYRALMQSGISRWRGARLGIYGFGAAGHLAIQVARARGAEVYVATREAVHRELAHALGAVWVGDALDTPPVLLDAGIVFAPAGELVQAALKHLDRGATLVLGGIHMSDIPTFPYASLYGERSVRSVANNTREDGRAFLQEAARADVHTRVRLYPFEALESALADLKRGLPGAAVLQLAEATS